jgi:hypothetical protein
MVSHGATRSFLILLVTAIAAAAAFYILQDHWGHALGFAPYLLFLACPLMHLFMHRGHTPAAENVSKKRKLHSSGGGCH